METQRVMTAKELYNLYQDLSREEQQLFLQALLQKEGDEKDGFGLYLAWKEAKEEGDFLSESEMNYQGGIMKNVTLEVSEQELRSVYEATQTLQGFLGKIISPNDLYKHNFLRGLHEAVNEMQSHNVNEVKTFDEFIG